MSNEFHYQPEEMYLAQGRGCAQNLQSDFNRATKNNDLADIDPREIDDLERRACMLNAIFCLYGEDDGIEIEEHPVCSITVPLKETLTDMLHQLEKFDKT